MIRTSREYRNEAEKAMVGRFGDVILFLVLTAVVSSGIVWLARYFGPVLDINGNIISPGIPFMVTVFSVIGLLYNSAIAYSTASVFIDITEKESFNVWEKIKLGFINDFARNIILQLVQSIFIVLWSMLFIIPGIVKSYAYSMTFYIAVKEPEQKGIDAITKSKNLMNGKKGDLFFLDFSYFGWYLLGLLTFGILWFWVFPKHMTARTIFFNDVYNASLKHDPAKKNMIQEPLF
jgi:uncharacterized membrane protein